jgi:hypothetical protein
MLSTSQSGLFDYFEMIAFFGRRRSSSIRHDAAAVEELMVSFVFAGFMESPILVEVVTGSEGAQSQNGVGAVQTPSGAGRSHAVFYQVSAGTFDNACGDR